MICDQDKPTFIVCDTDGGVAQMQLRVFGRIMLLPAIFLSEDDALHFTFEAEKLPLKSKLEILKVASIFTAESL